MNYLIINAINHNGNRSQFKITNDEFGHHRLYWDGNELYHQAGRPEEKIIDYTKYIMKGNDYRMEEIITQEDDSLHAITFDPAENGCLTVKFYEWMGGRYVQLGNAETYTVDCAKSEFGYC